MTNRHGQSLALILTVAVQLSVLHERAGAQLTTGDPWPAELVIPLPAVEPAEVLPLPPVDTDDALSGSDPSDSRQLWWDAPVGEPLEPQRESVRVRLDELVLDALESSPHVKVVEQSPVIVETAVDEAAAQFDLNAFMESKFIDTSDPVGSTLTTGGPDRYLDQNWNYSAGLRRQASSGGKFEVAQRIGYQDANSIFFVPAQQGTARLTMTLTQPLLNGAGQTYNRKLIALAHIDTQLAQDKVRQDLQQLIFDVHRAYWDLHLQRVLLLQKRALYEQAREIQRELEGRRDLDVLGSQLARAEAASATRYAGLLRQRAQVLNAESKLRMLTNSPNLGDSASLELIPAEPPNESPVEPSLEESLVTALENRAEISRAMHELRAASIRLNVAQHELMPVLNLILQGYASGLQGDAAIGEALGDQFSRGRPSYTAGLVFEVPAGNRAAQARLRRRRAETVQLTHQLEATIALLRFEVEQAVREIDVARREFESHYEAIRAGQLEVEYLESRWRLLPGDQQAAGMILDELLNAQDRLAQAQQSFIESLVNYSLAITTLRKVTGTLLSIDDYNVAANNQRLIEESPAPPAAPGEERRSSVIEPTEPRQPSTGGMAGRANPAAPPRR